MREDQARRYESEWQRRVVFDVKGNTMKVEIGRACWPEKIKGRLLKSLGAWEKAYGIQSVTISPAENLEDPGSGYIWVKGHPHRMASAVEGLKAIIEQLFHDAFFIEVAKERTKLQGDHPAGKKPIPTADCAGLRAGPSERSTACSCDF